MWELIAEHILKKTDYFVSHDPYLIIYIGLQMHAWCVHVIGLLTYKDMILNDEQHYNTPIQSLEGEGGSTRAHLWKQTSLHMYAL